MCLVDFSSEEVRELATDICSGLIGEGRSEGCAILAFNCDIGFTKYQGDVICYFLLLSAEGCFWNAESIRGVTPSLFARIVLTYDCFLTCQDLTEVSKFDLVLGTCKLSVAD